MQVATYSDQALRDFIFATHADTADCVSYHQTLLLTGAVPGVPDRGDYVSHTQPLENGVTPYLSSADAAAVYQLQYANACPWILASPGPLNDMDPAAAAAACASFGGGILTRGLAAAVREYLRRAVLVADTRLRMRLYFDAEHASGAGAVEPKASYNYSVDTDCTGGCWSATSYSLNGVTVRPRRHGVRRARSEGACRARNGVVARGLIVCKGSRAMYCVGSSAARGPHLARACRGVCAATCWGFTHAPRVS